MKHREYEMIIRWRPGVNRAGIEYQRLTYSAENLSAAGRRAFRFTQLLNSVGGYPPKSVMVVAVSELGALGKWQAETRVPIIRNRQEQAAAVQKVLAATGGPTGKTGKTGRATIKPLAASEVDQSTPTSFRTRLR